MDVNELFRKKFNQNGYECKRGKLEKWLQDVERPAGGLQAGGIRW